MSDSRLGQDHLVDHVNHAIAGQHVGAGDVRYTSALVGNRQRGADGQRLALHGFDGGVQRHFSLQNAARHDVVGQHFGQERGVGQQRGFGNA